MLKEENRIEIELVEKKQLLKAWGEFYGVTILLDFRYYTKKTLNKIFSILEKEKQSSRNTSFK